MPESLPPGLLLILGALLVPLVPARARPLYLLALPLASLASLLALPEGSSGHILLFEYTLTVVRVDALSRLFGLVFHAAALLSVLYALHVRQARQHVAALAYAGAGIGAVFAGDLITLFVYWELAAVTSAFLVWAQGTERSYRAGLRYLLVQVASGVLLLAGVLVHYDETGFLAFGSLGSPLGGDLGVGLIFLAFGIKAAFPLLHPWLVDAYPEATTTGTVFLSAFTTKMAVYALARGFAGVELLVPIGVTMALFPAVYAMVEDDLRRLLSYSLISQLGFMVVGVGIGTPLALNGAVSHAAASTLYQSLLFMAAGAVMLHTGTASARRLGGLYGALRPVAWCALIGAASISSLPLASGFVTKSMTLSAAAEGHYDLAWFGLMLAAAAVFVHTGIRFPYLAFFRRPNAERPGPGEPVPATMLAAMALTSLLCVGIGVFPQALYGMLPHAVEYHPYTSTHVVGQVQILAFALLAFAVAASRGWLPRPAADLLDADWLYRVALPGVARAVVGIGRPVKRRMVETVRETVAAVLEYVHLHHGPQGLFARTWGTANSMMIVVALLAVYLLYVLRTG